MHEESSFNWLSCIPILNGLPNHIGMSLIVSVILVCTTWIAKSQLMVAMQKEEAVLVPHKTLTYRNFFEILAESLYKLTVLVMGQEGISIYYPVIGSLFVFIFTSNIVGLIPGLLPPTENLNTTLALGVFVFIYYNYLGFKSHGIVYFKHFLGPVFWLAPLMLVIEIASHIFRPLSLALRLRGNIWGDHIVLGVFNKMVPYLLPTLFYGLGVFVAFLQAFVFCLMTMVYISLSTSHDH